MFRKRWRRRIARTAIWCVYYYIFFAFLWRFAFGLVNGVCLRGLYYLNCTASLFFFLLSLAVSSERFYSSPLAGFVSTSHERYVNKVALDSTRIRRLNVAWRGACTRLRGISKMNNMGKHRWRCGWNLVRIVSSRRTTQHEKTENIFIFRVVCLHVCVRVCAPCDVHSAWLALFTVVSSWLTLSEILCAARQFV